MTLNLQQLLLLGIFGASAHWIIARSAITKPIWSRLRGWPAKLLACPACSGFWLGLGLAAFGDKPVSVLCPYPPATAIAEVLASGVLATFLTPVFQAVMLWGLHYSAMPADESTPATEAEPAIDVTPVEPADGAPVDVTPLPPPPTAP